MDKLGDRKELMAIDLGYVKTDYKKMGELIARYGTMDGILDAALRMKRIDDQVAKGKKVEISRASDEDLQTVLKQVA